MKLSAEPVIQVLIIFLCLTVLAFQWGEPQTSAQTLCNGQPPIRDNTNPWSYYALKANMWLPGTSAISKRQIAVTIYDTNPTDAAKMEAGILTWNSFSDCAFVNFNNADFGSNPEGEPTDDKLWVTRGTNTQMFPHTDSTNQMISATIRVYTGWSEGNLTNGTRGLLRHETGHTFGLLNTAFGSGVTNDTTIMAGPYLEIRACDTEAIKKVYCPLPATSPTPYPSPPDGCLDPIENFNQGSCPLYFNEDSTGYYCCSVGCSYQAEEQVWDPSGYGELDCGVCQDGIDNDCGDGGADDQDYDCGDCWPSPILLDTLGDGFEMSSAANGVDFDIRGVGRPIRVSWSQGDDAWLALDRNGNGAIDNGKELFGNFTYQLSSPERNGFRALSVYDETANGGNADGVINAQDSIFPSLRLWMDSNRNGISEPSELFGLVSKNVAEIELDYKLSQRTDGKGNRFRYRAKVKSADGSQLGRWAWDVFLSTESSSGGSASASLIQPFEYYQPIRSTRPACGLKTRA